MQKHTKIYLKHFGLTTADFISSEISGGKAKDIHHIHRRGMGGDSDMDRIENLMALTDLEHRELGDKKAHKATLYVLHLRALKANKKPFDEKWITEQIEKY